MTYRATNPYSRLEPRYIPQWGRLVAEHTVLPEPTWSALRAGIHGSCFCGDMPKVQETAHSVALYYRLPAKASQRRSPDSCPLRSLQCILAAP